MVSAEYVRSLLQQGENSAIEFKQEDTKPDCIARELVAFSNYLGGTLLLGISDEGKIEGVLRKDREEWLANIARENVVPAINLKIGKIEIDDKAVYVAEIPKGTQKPYQTRDGKFWIRVGSTNRMATQGELMRLFQQSGMVHYDLNPVERTNKIALDFNKVHEYFRTSYQIKFNELEEQEQDKILFNSDILLEEEGKLSVSGLLIFGKDPQRFLPQSVITMAIFQGTELDAELNMKKEISGTLPEQIDNISSLLQLHLPNSSTIKGMKREEVDIIPSKVIRELLVNAVAHRDYSISTRRIQIFLFKDRLEINSPGRLPNTLTIEKVKTGNSALRNPSLIKYLDNLRYIDVLGRGIPMVVREMRDRVQFVEEGEIFKVKVWI